MGSRRERPFAEMGFEMKYTNKMNLPSSLVDAIINDPYDSGGADISVTTLIGPPKQRQLKKRHENEMVEDVADWVWALVGNNTHYIIQRTDKPDSLQEERLFMTAGGWKISGQADLYEGRIISDWKVTSVWAVLHGLKPEWEQQVNIYGHLFRNAGFPIDGLQIVAVLRDWSKYGGQRSKGYPLKQVVTLPVPLWSHDKTQAYIEARVELHQAAEAMGDDEIPICTPEERWHEDDKWAVVKGNNKRATRVLDSLEEAETLKADLERKGPDSYRIDERIGSDKRCLDYCSCNQFCNHYRNTVPF